MKSSASFYEAAGVALGSLRASKLRSFLTLLGIILATTTLIAVMSIINGMNQYIAKQVSDMGADGFRVRRIIMIGNFDREEVPGNGATESGDEPWRSSTFIKANATLVREFGMEACAGVQVSVTGAKRLTGFNASALRANMAVISNLQVVSGRFIAETMTTTSACRRVHRQRSEAAVLSERGRGRQDISIDGRPFEVIGVAKALGSVFGQSRDNFVMIPAETFFKMFGVAAGTWL